MDEVAGIPDIEIGVDTGGTFTDVVCREIGGATRIVKIPSTPADPGQAILDSLDYMLREWGIAPSRISRFVHGTTVATNAVLERKGAKVGLLATAGFGDVIAIGRQFRKEMYRAIMTEHTPTFLAPGRQRREVIERIGASGQIVTPLDEDSVRVAVRSLVEDEGVRAISVCFLFSFLNDAHEMRTRSIIQELYPQIPVSLSCEVNPAFREYERTVATTFDAYVKPVLSTYLARLEACLADAGVPAPLQVMQSRGGISSATIARSRPIRLFLSGPAAGVVGGRMAGENVGYGDLITVDVGGTSSDIALISRGKPMLRQEGLVDGYPIRVGMVDVNAIGAGGGSIAWIDGVGGLRVGPQSAGSDPGPACYGRGGQLATVTDASIVLGYLNPDYFAGGLLRLDPRLSHDVIERTIAKPLGMTCEDAARGIHRIINAQMAEGIRLVSINQGIDARDYALVPLGGAGAIHATALADELSIQTILVPVHPGVLSATGLLASHVEHEMSAAVQRDLAGTAAQDLRAVLDRLDAACSELMAIEGVTPADVEIAYFADMCFSGQSYNLDVALDMAAASPIEALYEAFLLQHDRVFGYAARSPAMIVNLRAVHRARTSQAENKAEPPPATVPLLKGKRAILLAGGDWVNASIYARTGFAPRMAVDGPCVIEQADTTTLVDAGWRATALPDGTLHLARI